ncbi:MAG: APC family permease [Pseudomonadota bacterium]
MSLAPIEPSSLTHGRDPDLRRTTELALDPDSSSPHQPNTPGPREAGRFGLWSGIGLVIANTIGVGVLTSNGYMAVSMTPDLIFLVWVIQGVVAILGARAYAGIAAIVPSSGGEYRYLSDLLHPSLGCLAGWTSLLIGFAAPIAANAYAAGLFLQMVSPATFANARITGAAIIVILTLLQATNLRASKLGQDSLAILKAILFGTFVIVGFVLGTNRWPAPLAEASPSFPTTAFALNLFYAAYAYSGWNAAIYAAGEFKDPRRTVPRAMTIGSVLVTLAYLAITWVFVANLSGTDMKGWDEHKATVAHLIVRKLIGPTAASTVSLGIVVVLVSAMSAMMLLGPRVNAAMARDGFLPRILGGRKDLPPFGAVLLQGVLALALLCTHSFEMLMANIGVVLTFSSALTVLALFRLRLGYRHYPRPGLGAITAGGGFVIAAAWSLFMAFSQKPQTILWVASICAISAGGYYATKKWAPKSP